MISIQVDYLNHDKSVEFKVHRVPCVGEYLMDEGYSYVLQVVEVIHNLNPKRWGIIATVRVK